MFPLIETGWNLPCKQVLCIMKRLRHGKHLSMISFLPTQCMIFSTRFVVQSVKDFHPCKCKPIRKTAISHAKQKRQGFHPYRLTFIFSQRRRHGYHRAFFLLESVHGIVSPVSSLSGKLLHPMQNKSGRASTIPLNVYFLPTQTTRLSLPEFVHRIAPPVQTILTSQTYPESCYIHEKQSGTVFTHTA